ncbi:MAG: hypothetical protein LV477_01745 [Candidatus Nitrosotalea sp.]|nr:hypothetical protein [Candidatus Nitrosotalea sp.]
MKTLHLSVIVIVGIGAIIMAYLPNVYAPCAIGPNGTQLCGGPPPIHMTVKSDSMAYADGDKITISGTVDKYILSKYGTSLSIKIYNPKMVLYRSDQFNTISNGSFVYSFKISGENATSGYYNFYLSPDLNTMSYGSAFMYQATPYDLEVNGTHYSLVYVLADGVINRIDASLMEKSITIHVVNATGHSTLKIKLPRDLIDSKSDQGDTGFTVLADNTPETQYMQSVNFNETQTYSDTRTLLIDLPFHPYSTDGNWYVKIIGTSMNLENKNPHVIIPDNKVPPFNTNYSNNPVIINQVELATALQPGNQSGTDCTVYPNGTKICQTYQSPYSTDVHSPYYNIQCAFFNGICQLTHQVEMLGDQCDSLQQYPQGTQWIQIYNQMNSTVHLTHFGVTRIPDDVLHIQSMPPQYAGADYAGSTNFTMSPHQICSFGFIAGPIGSALEFPLNDTSLAIAYDQDGVHHMAATPFLADSYNDTKTWQYDGNNWVFDEQNTVKVPEFGILAIPVFLIGTVSVIAFYRMKFGK